MSESVLLTGATGLVGSRLRPLLEKQGLVVHALTRGAADAAVADPEKTRVVIDMIVSTLLSKETMRPPLFLMGLSKDFSGFVSGVRSSKAEISLKRWPGVVGLYFLIAIIP